MCCGKSNLVLGGFQLSCAMVRVGWEIVFQRKPPLAQKMMSEPPSTPAIQNFVCWVTPSLKKGPRRKESPTAQWLQCFNFWKKNNPTLQLYPPLPWPLILYLVLLVTHNTCSSLFFTVFKPCSEYIRSKWIPIKNLKTGQVLLGTFYERGD